MEFKFIETEVFTKLIQAVLADEEYGLLQAELIRNPTLGAMVPGGKGIRKLRWALPGKGKSGGVRVLYYLYLSTDEIYMLYVFKKSEQSNFKGKQLAVLAEFVRKYLKD